MIDSNELAALIRDKIPFRIGTRGICIECCPNIHSKIWVITIDRAFVELHVQDIAVLDDADFFMLSFDPDGKGEYLPLADLSRYDKITVLYQRVIRR